MPRTTVERPAEPIAGLDCHVDPDWEFVTRSEGVRAWIRKRLHWLVEIDTSHGGLSRHEEDA